MQDDQGNVYELNGEDSRMLATIGVFRVIAERDLETVRDPDWDPRNDTLEHLRDEGLIRFVAIDEHERAVVLTDEGRDVLDAHRRERDEDDGRQEFHADVSHPRELKHDSALFEACLTVEERLRNQGADIERVVLEQDLRREYQAWLQERNKGNPDSDGGRVAIPAKSPSGLENVTSRTSMTESTSRTSASSTSWTAATDTRTSKS